MSDIQLDSSFSPKSPLRYPTACHPWMAKTFTVNKPDMRNAKLTEAQQDTMFERLEKTPAIYDTHLIGNVKMNASKSLQLPYSHYKCLVINKHDLRLLTNKCESNENMLSLRILGACF